MSAKIHKSVISRTEIEEIRNWIISRIEFASNGMWQGKGYEGKTKRLNVYTKECNTPQPHIIDVPPKSLLCLKDTGLSLSGANLHLNDFSLTNIEILEDGDYVPEHIDDNFGASGEHVRFNVLISKPLSGGEPVIDGCVIELEEGDAWSFTASQYYHSCRVVSGTKPRITASFGYSKCLKPH